MYVGCTQQQYWKLISRWLTNWTGWEQEASNFFPLDLYHLYHHHPTHSQQCSPDNWMSQNVSFISIYFFYYIIYIKALIANLTRNNNKKTSLQCFRKHTSLQDKALSEWGVGIETTQQRHDDQPANTHTRTRTHTPFDKRGFEMWKAATSFWQERLSIMSSRILLQVFCVWKARW